MEPEGTRRLSAILFADMVGYSALSHHDEARALELAQEFQRRLASRLGSFRGRLVKTLGDGVLAEFESALEATQCAIAIQKDLHEANTDRQGPRLEVRMGIHVGDVVRQNEDVVGDTVNITARIEPLAEPGGVAISGTVYEQVGKKIPYSSTQLEHAFLKNIDTPIAVYSLDLPWHGAPAARVTPFTARAAELAQLRATLVRAAQGHGSIVAVTGESGVGKTRLSTEAFRLASRQGYRTARARSFENVRVGPYALWAEITRELLRDAPSPWLYKAADGCARELAGLLPELSDRLGPLPPRPELTPDQARLQFFAGVSRFIENVARDAPLAILLDDLQWSDRETVSFVQYLSQRIDELRVLVILTFRGLELDPDDPLLRAVQDLRLKRSLTEIALRRLGAEETPLLVEAALGGASVSPGLTPQIAETTGGNPLFVEEVLRSLAEEEALVRTATGWAIRPGSTVSIPLTVRETVLRRVRRLGPDLQAALEAASIFGNEFEFDDWKDLCGLNEALLLPLAEAALRTRLVVEREVAPGRAVYRLADEQVQAALYSTISLTRRQRLHRRTGEVLEGRLGVHAADRAAELAHHYLLGDRPEKAFEFFRRAGDRAREIFAHEQAIEAYGNAASLVEQALAESVDRDEWERRGALVYEELGNEEFEIAAHGRARVSYLRGSLLAGPRDPIRASRLSLYAGMARMRNNDYSGASEELDAAARVLENQPPANRGDAWWTAWREVQTALFDRMYWLHDTKGREQLIERLRPALESRGRADDVAHLYYLLAIHGWRRDRTVTDESFDFYRRAWELWEADRKRQGAVEPTVGENFVLGFMQYWHGDFNESRAQLKAALSQAERSRNVTMIARATNYLLAAGRRLGDLEEVRRLVPTLQQAAGLANLPEYGAFAVANDAWVRWRSGQIDQVDVLGQAALDTWAGVPERYPVDWMALWPLIALALSRGDSRRAIDLARGLLAPTQEPLPLPLQDLVHRAITMAETGNLSHAVRDLNQAVEMAKQLGFL